VKYYGSERVKPESVTKFLNGFEKDLSKYLRKCLQALEKLVKDTGDCDDQVQKDFLAYKYMESFYPRMNYNDMQDSALFGKDGYTVEPTLAIHEALDPENRESPDNLFYYDEILQTELLADAKKLSELVLAVHEDIGALPNAYLQMKAVFAEGNDYDFSGYEALVDTETERLELIQETFVDIQDKVKQNDYLGVLLTDDLFENVCGVDVVVREHEKGSLQSNFEPIRYLLESANKIISADHWKRMTDTLEKIVVADFDSIDRVFEGPEDMDYMAFYCSVRKTIFVIGSPDVEPRNYNWNEIYYVVAHELGHLLTYTCDNMETMAEVTAYWNRSHDDGEVKYASDYARTNTHEMLAENFAYVMNTIEDIEVWVERPEEEALDLLADLYHINIDI